MTTPPRRFVYISRTVNANGAHTLDAIDNDGRAPETWTELQPLPSRKDRP